MFGEQGNAPISSAAPVAFVADAITVFDKVSKFRTPPGSLRPIGAELDIVTPSLCMMLYIITTDRSRPRGTC
jgi:hypothetical protein